MGPLVPWRQVTLCQASFGQSLGDLRQSLRLWHIAYKAGYLCGRPLGFLGLTGTAAGSLVQTLVVGSTATA